jgi:hypothetical protein
VGKLYYSGRWVPGALARWGKLLREDPDYSKKDEVYFYTGEALMKGGADPAQALAFYERLVAEFPKSKYFKKSQIRIKTIKSVKR